MTNRIIREFVNEETNKIVYTDNRTNIGSIIGGIIGGPFGAILGNKAYGAFTGRDGRGPGTGNLGGMGPGAFGPGLGEFVAAFDWGARPLSREGVSAIRQLRRAGRDPDHAAVHGQHRSKCTDHG